MTTLFESIQMMKRELPQLYAIHFGYPLGDNVVRNPNRPNGLPQEFVSMYGAKWLTELYSACDGVILPDVHVGYFLKPMDRVISFDKSSEPDTVILSRHIEVLPIGSTGGGGLFVVECDQGSVLLLPPGPMRQGRYDGTRCNVKEVANSVPLFVERLLADVKAFINNDKMHRYIA